MYGYIRTDKYELKYKDYIEYKKYYCAVCNSLKNNLGKKWCMLTSYDATLFLLLFDALEKEKQEIELTCPLNPFFHHNISVSQTAMFYTTFISLFYYYAKLKDNIIDEKKRKYRRRLQRFLNNDKCNAVIGFDKGLYERLDILLQEYFQMEKAANYNFDDYTNKMGELFGHAFLGLKNITKSTVNERALYKLGFNLGKWIYIMDAFDDLEEDIEKCKFNPILYMKDFSILDEETLCQKFLFMSQCLCQGIYYEIGKLNIKINLNIILNIVESGMNKSALRLIAQRKEDGGKAL